MTGDVEFDRIAPVYDETRRPPSGEELGTLVTMLRGCRTVLDAGVGTGRFAVPLHERGFEIVGVDLSFGMMGRARTKGVSALVRANALWLPIADRAVDATFMAHVLQLIPDARTMLRELGRVARRRVVVQLPRWFEQRPSEPWRERRTRYREIAAELGYTLPERGPRYFHSVEELSEIARPSEVRVVTVPSPEGEPSEERAARWAATMMGGGQIPTEVHAEILRRLRVEFPRDAAWRRGPRTSRFIAWDARRLTERA
ncbi:MAG TPA: class I SAM-dependent methyltransferase [Thermoplasmata archaeon]|nr:class I SAM-dependent methyltransferase [Thermoplasmata archaeon]